jgi:hypothetical protein
MMNVVNNALGTNLNKDTYNKDFSSLNQGLEMLSERKNYINKISKQQKVIEGATTNENSSQIAAYKALFEEKKKIYNNKLSGYKTDYEEFIRKFNTVEKEVRDCKIDICESTYNVLDGDTDEDIKNKQKKKNACKAGCHFNLPIILDCKENEVFTKSEGGDTCSSLSEKCAVGNLKDDQGRNAQTELLGIVDDNGISAWKGCCDCNLDKKYKPYFISGGEKYMRCLDFGSTPNDPLVAACETGEAEGKITVQKSYFPRTYKTLKQKNKQLVDTSNDILKIVKDLNDLNEDILKKGASELSEIKGDSLALEKINKDIINLSNKTKNITLNKQLSDKYMLKKSTDLHLYLWAILALGFGLTAIIKINKL